MSLAFRLAVSVVFVALAVLPARAEDTGLAAFAGEWVGTAVSETPADPEFQTTTRDIGIEIVATGDGGFTLQWSTLQRQKGDPSQPLETLKETSVTFAPAASLGVWHMSPQGNISVGETVYTARMEGLTLIVNGFAVNAEGKAELQTYTRTLDNEGMSLNFTRVVDGAIVRTATGRLVRFSN